MFLLRFFLLLLLLCLPFKQRETLYQLSLTYLEGQKCYGPDKKTLYKKQLFGLEVKVHYGTRHTALWSCTHIPNIIDLAVLKTIRYLLIYYVSPSNEGRHIVLV
jgi:hypothetical protein